MKRISTLLLSAAMFFGAVGAAQAIDVKVKGQFDFAYGWGEHTKFTDSKHGGDRDRDSFIAKQRVRTQVNFIASESLQAVLMFEIGTIDWGRGGTSGRGSGGALDADGVNIETKRAYLDWVVPNTDLAIRMGIQGLYLPSATYFGNPVFGADVAGIVASYQFDDMFGLTAFWARPFDAYGNDNESGLSNRKLADEVDMFGLIAPITGDGWALTPWGVVASVGAQSGLLEYLFDPNYTSDKLYDGEYSDEWGKSDRALAWWAGTGFEMTMFDPLTFGFDVMYGSLGRLEGSSLSSDTGFKKISTKGWFIDARLDYKFDWATAGIFGWWSTGDKKSKVKDGKFGRIPVVGVDDGFQPTSFGFAGNVALTDNAIVSSTGAGTWGIGLQLADMSFIEDLTHTLRVAYYRGTNDRELADKDGLHLPYAVDMVYMTTKDYAWEVNFDHKYQIYENLAAYLELGYIHLNLHDKHFQRDDDSAWKAQVIFQYKF